MGDSLFPPRFDATEPVAYCRDESIGIAMDEGPLGELVAGECHCSSIAVSKLAGVSDLFGIPSILGVFSAVDRSMSFGRIFPDAASMELGCVPLAPASLGWAQGDTVARY